MLHRKAHIPYSIYQAQPYIYAGSGVLTLVYLPNVFGIFSGLLLICAGVLVIVWRGQKTPAKRQPALRGRDRTRRDAGARDVPDAVEADRTRPSSPASELNDFSTTENPWHGSEPSSPVQHQIGHIADGAPVTGSLLARFTPFNELDEALRECFARGLIVSRKPARSVLVKRGSEDDVSIYLIEGTLILRPADRRTMRVVGGTQAAVLPLCQLSPHTYSAIAATDVAVIILRQSVLRDVTKVINEHKNTPGIQVSHLQKT